MTDKETSSAKSVSISGRKERERLRRQNLLLSQAEKPALEHFFKGKSELSVLDIGCNDGARTFHRFSDDRISRVIGLEYNQQLVERANSQYGNTKFSFIRWMWIGIRFPRIFRSYARNRKTENLI